MEKAARLVNYPAPSRHGVCDWCGVRLDIKSIRSRNRTCSDCDARLIKPDAASAEIAVVLRPQQLYLARESIDGLSIASLTTHDICVQCVTFNGTLDKDKWFTRAELCILYVQSLLDLFEEDK